MSDTLCLHRHNPDFTWDSICPYCSLIIARVNDELNLSKHEEMHVCDPATLRKPPIDFHVFLQR